MGDVLALSHVLKTRQFSTRLPNAELRPREYLEDEEVERLIKAAGKVGRHPIRDALMIRMAAKHGYRTSELCALRWAHIDFNSRNPRSRLCDSRAAKTRCTFLTARSCSHSRRTVISIRARPMSSGTSAGARLSPGAFWKIVRRAGAMAGFEFPVHPHMLRHHCGYRLTNEGQDTRSVQAYMGHKKPENAQIYTKMSPNRFRNF